MVIAASRSRNACLWLLLDFFIFCAPLGDRHLPVWLVLTDPWPASKRMCRGGVVFGLESC